MPVLITAVIELIFVVFDLDRGVTFVHHHLLDLKIVEQSHAMRRRYFWLDKRLNSLFVKSERLYLKR